MKFLEDSNAHKEERVPGSIGLYGAQRLSGLRTSWTCVTKGWSGTSRPPPDRACWCRPAAFPLALGRPLAQSPLRVNSRSDRPWFIGPKRAGHRHSAALGGQQA